MINFYAEIKARLPFKQKFVGQIMARIIKELKIKKNFELTILLVGDRKIRLLNKKYRHQDKVTDVLSFSQKEGRALVLPESEKKYLGDIVICWPQIKRQAKKFKQTATREFSLLLIHGFLHLLGHEDDTRANGLKMAKLQDKILAKIYD